MIRSHLLKTLLLAFPLALIIQPIPVEAQDQWQEVETETHSVERHENAFTRAGDKFYLVGGRGIRPTDIYDPQTETWTQGAPTPIEISHFQAVSHQGLIYLLGGMTGNWPSETPLTHIYIYDPLIDKWTLGPEIPPRRQRGGAGVVVYDDKIYLVCGVVNGHASGWVPWLDEFDPATGRWRELPDAPHARDHFQAAVAGDKLVATGGRLSGYGEGGFGTTFGETDIYDFITGTWETLPSPEGDIPTDRAGTAVTAMGDEVVIIGGESGEQIPAHDEVEALNPETGVWRTLPPLQQGRHGTQVIHYGSDLYIQAGSGDRGGGPELNLMERLHIPDADPVEGDPITAGTLKINTEQHDFGQLRPYATAAKTFELSNEGGNQAILITYMILTGSDTFELDFPYPVPYILGPDQTVQFEVTWTPESSDPEQATLLIKRFDRGDQQPLELSLTGNGE